MNYIKRSEAEGGCGVIGIACSEKIAGRHLLESLKQMRNRGNGKGGGIAAVGLIPEELGVTREILERDYILNIAYLDPSSRSLVERDYIEPVFEIDKVRVQPHIDLRITPQPPEVFQYFVRVKKNSEIPNSDVEDEIVYRNSFHLNRAFYAATGEKRAFVLSHGKNMLVLKMVGYGDDVIRYYNLEDFHAHIWIGHHRYPTKGKVWHPGGAHPFVGLNEALVHNGDFANYASICEYLAQRDIYPLFLTDTEVAALLFDLLHRIYRYPLEYVIESLAPTTERDFTLLPEDKQKIYQLIQVTHIHGSPDGPWFFLIAQSDTRQGAYRLIGITDTSMLRPQVFALQEGQVQIGFAASEKQAIDAALESLAEEDPRFWSRADRYWNARGGSHTDGGAFIFTVRSNETAPNAFFCTDKFGKPLTVSRPARAHAGVTVRHLPSVTADESSNPLDTYNRITDQLKNWEIEDLRAFLSELEDIASNPGRTKFALELLTLLIDRRYPTGKLRRSLLLSLFDKSLAKIINHIKNSPSELHPYTTYQELRPIPASPSRTIIIDARNFPPEGKDSLACEIVRLYKNGFRKFMIINTKGHRFIACGLGPKTSDVRIDVYGSPGDYLASGIDGASVHLHNNGQDQLAQIMKDGKLVVYGDVRQTFMYAAKGGEAYLLGNAAGRPLINAVGRPRVVINGTCLDYLAESFMAGDPLNGGGFVILNGITFDEEGSIIELETPYPGGNLFSLASGGAIYIRDPKRRVSRDQLNGGEFALLEERDWRVIKPYLEENENLFGIPVSRLLEVSGAVLPPERVYRKIRPKKVRALEAEVAWVTEQDS